MAHIFEYYNGGLSVYDEIISVPAVDISPLPDLRINFIGLALTADVLPKTMWSGATTEPAPIPGNWHACMVEWGCVIHAVKHSGPRFRIVEVGCAWGCWIQNARKLSRLFGKTTFKGVGIDGDQHMLDLAESIAELNYRLERARPDARMLEMSYLRGVAGSGSGDVYFGNQPSEISFGLKAIETQGSNVSGKFTKLKWYSLSELSGGDRLSLLHIDIQGNETSFIKSNITDINQLVEKMIIGTHSREIEGRLMELLTDNGWRLICERPCIFDPSRFYASTMPKTWVDATNIDGVQYWVNTRLANS